MGQVLHGSARTANSNAISPTSSQLTTTDDG